MYPRRVDAPRMANVDWALAAAVLLAGCGRSESPPPPPPPSDSTPGAPGPDNSITSADGVNPGPDTAPPPDKPTPPPEKPAEPPP